jgi:hypothetical protein
VNGYNLDFPAWLKILHLGTVISTPIFFWRKGQIILLQHSTSSTSPFTKDPEKYENYKEVHIFFSIELLETPTDRATPATLEPNPSMSTAEAPKLFGVPQDSAALTSPRLQLHPLNEHRPTSHREQWRKGNGKRRPQIRCRNAGSTFQAGQREHQPHPWLSGENTLADAVTEEPEEEQKAHPWLSEENTLADAVTGEPEEEQKALTATAGGDARATATAAAAAGEAQKSTSPNRGPRGHPRYIVASRPTSTAIQVRPPRSRAPLRHHRPDGRRWRWGRRSSRGKRDRRPCLL